jgi:hypothetical protein
MDGQNSLLRYASLHVDPLTRGSCVYVEGNTPALSIFNPVLVIGALRMLLLPNIHHHPIELDLAIEVYDSGQ